MRIHSSPFCDIVTSVLVTNWRRPGTNLDGHQVRSQLGSRRVGGRYGNSKKPRPGRLGLRSSRSRLWRLSERTLGGSSPPATREHITKPKRANGTRKTENQVKAFPIDLRTYVRHNHPSTRPISAASTASRGATFPSSATLHASNLSILRSVASGVDLLASTAI